VPVWKREVGVDISEHLVGGESAGLQDLVVDCHAYRLARVIVDNALAAYAVGAQTLEDGVLGEDLGHPFGLVCVDAGLPAVQCVAQRISVRHFDLRRRA